MLIKNQYKKRSIRFLEIINHQEWEIKVYSISIHNEKVSKENLAIAKENLELLLSKSKDYNLPTYNLGTLIIHEGREGVFYIMNWWIDENMLQNVVYLKKNQSNEFKFYSNNGICTCVWEMAIWWHERNAWVKHILMKNNNPDKESYLKELLNIDI